MTLSRPFSRLSVGHKITLLVSLFVATVVASGFMTWQFAQRQAEVSRFVERSSSLSERLLYLDEVLTMSARMAALTQNDHWLERYDRHADEIDSVIDRLLDLAPGAVAVQFEASTATANEALFAEERSAFEALESGDGRLAADILLGDEYQRHKTELDRGTEQFLAAIATEAETRLERLERFSRLILFITVLSLTVAIGFSVAIIRSITRPLIEAVDYANRIAEGDLQLQPEGHGRDETAQLLQAMGRMAEQLRTLLRQIRNSATSVADASQELSSVSSHTRSGAEQQMDQTTQVAASMDQMTRTVQEVAGNAQETAQAAQSAGERAGEARQVVLSSSDSLQTLAQDVHQAAEVVQELERRGVSIDKVLTMMRDIAEQTNLLALNAAIEAARAGEHGRGFAVVSGEVRKLANNTQQFIGEIGDIIQSLQSDTRRAVAVMTASNDSAKTAVSQSEQAVAKLDESLRAVIQIEQLSAQVASAAEQQSGAADEINRNINAINEVATDTGQAVGKISRSSEELARLAAQLDQGVARFQL